MAADAGDPVKMKDIAHGFKSMSGNVGAVILSSLLQDLENQVQNDEEGRAVHMIRTIREEYGICS